MEDVIFPAVLLFLFKHDTTSLFEIFFSGVVKFFYGVEGWGSNCHLEYFCLFNFV